MVKVNNIEEKRLVLPLKEGLFRLLIYESEAVSYNSVEGKKRNTPAFLSGTRQPPHEQQHEEGSTAKVTRVQLLGEIGDKRRDP